MKSSHYVIPVITDFEFKVYKITSKIPKGQTMSYGAIARILHSSPRAVGQALKRNPFAPDVPCHRVINKDGSIGGFAGVMNSRKKIKLLKSEGIAVHDNKISINQ